MSYSKQEVAMANRIIKRTQELLAGPNQDGSAWIKGKCAASGRRGAELDEKDDKAKCFCTIGGLNRASYELTGSMYGQGSDLAKRKVGYVMGGDIPEANDKRSTTFGQVMVSLDLARALPKTVLKDNYLY